MAESYDRRINMYINIDGKDVVNSVRSIRAEMNKLIGQQSNMTVGSEEYVKATRSIQRLKGILKTHAEDIGRIETPLQKVIGFAKSLIPAFSFAALGALATQAFGKITSATDAMADKWEIAMAGMKNGTDYFWRSLASGDFTNFLSNLSEAIKVGEKYAKILDSVEDKIRSLSIVESDSRAEVLRLEEAVKNKQLSKDDRIKAGEERIKLEEDLSAKRTKIADEEFGAEILISSQRTGLSKEQLIQITKDIDSESKLKADAYNQQIEHYNQLKRQNVFTTTSPTTGGSSTKQLPDSQEMINLKKELDSAPDSVKAYAGAINQYSNLTKDMMDRLASSYIKKNTAEDSAIENTKKVRNLVHTLMAGQDAEGQKLTDNKTKEELDNTTKALDLGYKQQQLLLKQKYATEETMQKEFQARMLATEIAYMQTKLQLTTDENERVDLQSQIIDKQVAYTAALKEAVPEIINTDNAVAKLNTRLLEESKLLDFAAQKQAQGASDQADYTAKQMQQAETIKMVGDIMTDYVTGALNGSIDEFQSFGDTLILMSLQMLKMMVPIWSAQILGLSLSSPESVATWGVAGMAKFAIISGLMYAGISAVEGLVKGGISKKREAAGNTVKHAAGGFTQGETTYIAGESGTEYIAPNWQVTHPLTGPIIAQLESWRKNPITVSSGAIEASRPFAASNTRSIYNKNVSTDNTIQISSDPELKNIMAENTKAIKELMTWKPAIAIADYERKRNNWKKTTSGGIN